MVNLTLEQPQTKGAANARVKWGRRQIGDFRYYLFRLCILCQLITVLMTWELWQVREMPPVLPVFEWLPQFSFGPVVILSLVYLFVDPKRGLFVHAAVLIIASLFDQMRMQPQFMAIWVMMLATVFEKGASIGRWFLISMWIWAGLHKALSPDWMGMRSWSLVSQARWDPNTFHILFAYVVAFGEIGAGIIGIFKPRWAVLVCPALHLGIIVFLSPLLADWNRSVFPWNFCTAIVGAWIFFEASSMLPKGRIEWAVVAALFISPVGFYYGWMDHGYANVLYSDNLPRAVITSEDGSRPIRGWGNLRVPFPNERRLFRSHFERSSPPGSKLHIYDPRPTLPEQYFELDKQLGLVEISRKEFFAPNDKGIVGRGFESQRAIFRLGSAGAQLLRRDATAPIYAVRFDPAFYAPELLDCLVALGNVEQIQLAGCNVEDEDLKRLEGLFVLKGIGLNQTRVTDKGLEYLRNFPNLRHVDCRDTAVTKLGLSSLLDK